jgi:aspartate/methionine/tyrosine aminotransferase
MSLSHVSYRAERLSPSGIRVIFDKASKIKDVVRLEIGEPDFDTPEHIKKAAVEAMNQGYTHYSSNRGFLDLRQAISQKLRKDTGQSFSPETEIMATAGGSSAITLSILATINPGDEVLIPDPGWPLYEQVVSVADGKPVKYPLYEKDEFSVNPENIKTKITKKTKMIIINSPANPTGGTLPKTDLNEVAKLAKEHNLLILSDEVYEKIVYDEFKHFSVASVSDIKDNVIVINSFSKTYAMTGWRLGFVATKSEIIAQISKINSFLTTCANTIAQKAGIVALKSSQDCVKKMVAEYSARRDYLTKRLNEIKSISCLIPKGAFYIFANISKLNMSSFKFCIRLLDEAHVASVPGSSFGLLGENYVRFTYANSMQELEKAADKIEQFTEKLV